MIYYYLNYLNHKSLEMYVYYMDHEMQNLSFRNVSVNGESGILTKTLCFSTFIRLSPNLANSSGFVMLKWAMVLWANFEPESGIILFPDPLSFFLTVLTVQVYIVQRTRFLGTLLLKTAVFLTIIIRPITRCEPTQYTSQLLL